MGDQAAFLEKANAAPAPEDKLHSQPATPISHLLL
jgi:hypothetical protein